MIAPILPMNPRFALDASLENPARIAVIGVGGGGGNAINNMILQGLSGVHFIAINTDKQDLDRSNASTRIQIGKRLTGGKGAGARSIIGAEAVEENRSEIEEAIRDFDMVFITAGMGGGTGTGGAPVVAEIAHKLGILTVGVVTKPFVMESQKRMNSAEEGINRMREFVDTLVVIPNENLLKVASESTPLIEAFRMADNVLYNATRGISDLITQHGLINLDFADVRTTMKDKGLALVGTAEASGENRAEKAVLEAISSPLLGGRSISGATNVLVNITGDSSLGMHEFNRATTILNTEAGPGVEIIMGCIIDPAMGDSLRITVVVTGFDKAQDKAKLVPPPSAPAATPPQSKGPQVIRMPSTTPPTLPPTPMGRVEDSSKSGYTLREDPKAARRPQIDAPTPPVPTQPTSSPRVIRLSPDVSSRSDRPSRRDDTLPAFLRKQLD